MRRPLALVIGLLVLTAFPPSAEAQTPGTTIELRIAKVNGFNLGGQIQGRFRLTASGPDDLDRVVFLIDGAPMATITASPFRMTFDTGSYELGRHILTAQGETPSGTMLGSNILTVAFVSPATARRSVLQIVIPIFVIVGLAGIAAAVGPLIGRGDRRGRRGGYGIAGGAVCKRCGLPFSRHLITLRFLGVRLERCRHCGKWQFAARAGVEELAQAEARMGGQPQHESIPTDDEDTLRRMIEDSRFED